MYYPAPSQIYKKSCLFLYTFLKGIVWCPYITFNLEITYYHIRGTFGGNFNLTVWRSRLQLPSLTYANTNIIIVMCIIKQSILNIALFTKINVRQIAVHSNSLNFANILCIPASITLCCLLNLRYEYCVCTYVQATWFLRNNRRLQCC